MVIVGFKLPHGLKAKAKRNGYAFAKYSNQLNYHLKKKNSPPIVEKHQHFGQIMKGLKLAYKDLSDEDRQALRQRRKEEGSTKSDWIHFIREYYQKETGIQRQRQR
jgi:hypothetical protein